MEIPVISWLDKPIKHAVWSLFDDLNKATEAMDIFRKYRRNHFKRLTHSVRYIKILGMSQPVLLTRIYSPAMVSTTIYGRLYEQDWLSASSPPAVTPTRPRRVNRPVTRADEFIDSHSRVAVLGPAGSGKTTLLRHLALAMCDKEIFATTKLQTSRFPFFVALPSYAKETAGDQSIVDYLSMKLAEYTDGYAPEFVRRVLRKGHALILFDSLDEVPKSLRATVVDQIKEISSGFPESHIVLSCRTADYDPISENFYEVELSPLTSRAVSTIVEAWFGEDREQAANLLRHLRRDEAVRSLCETPLLLSLLCIQFRHDLALPQRKTELFRRCIDAFLRDWDASRGFRRDSVYSNLSDDRKIKIFESIAGKFLTTDMRYTFPDLEVIQCIAQCCDLFGISMDEAQDLLREIEAHHGILERFSADSYTFSHQSFQEYFSARNLLAQRREVEEIRKNLGDERWAGVIEFVAAMSEDPGTLLEFLAERSGMRSIKSFPAMARRTRTLFILYRCLSSGVNIPNERRQDLYAHIVGSHSEMLGVFQNGGVFPLPVLVRDGVRYAYLYYRKRRTLNEALQPLRRLANEILWSPSDMYVRGALARATEMAYGHGDIPDLMTVTETLGLTIPVARSQPGEVGRILKQLKSRRVANLVPSDIIDESLQVLEEDFGA